jgi:hypothetical protein
MTDKTTQRHLNDILRKFPYNSNPNQLERLTEFFLLNAGNAPKEVKEQLDIYHNTQRKIRDAWNDLSQHEQAFLWNQMSQYLTIQSATEEGVPEETTGQ